MLLLLLIVACRNDQASAPKPLLGALLAVAAEVVPVDRDLVDRELGILRRRVDAAAKTGLDLPAAYQRAVFEESMFAREVDDTDARFVLLPSVLADRRGSCVGLGAVYLVLAEQRGDPLEGVIVPGHFFVRAPGRRNLELLRQGEVMPDAFYAGKYLAGRAPAPAHLRALGPAEVAAVARFNLGNEQRRAGRLGEAERFYRAAAAQFPGLGEAHASLGLVLQLAGRRAEAEAAYAAARRADPALPGIEHNLEALRAGP